MTKPKKTSTPLFRGAVITNGVVLAVTFVGMILVAFFGANPTTPTQQSFYGFCEKVAYMTVGAFLGLLGGNAATPDTTKD